MPMTKAGLNQRIIDAIKPAAKQPQELDGHPHPNLRAEPDVQADTAPSLEPSEAQVVERAREDPAAFGALYETYVDRIYAYIYHRVGNVQDAEDLTARTFYRALDKLDTYEDRGLPFSAWLFRIAHNVTANWHRDRTRRRFLSIDRLWGHSHDGDTPERQVEQEETHAALWAAIRRLPEDRRTLLLLKFGSQMSNVEIGALLHKSESAIKSLYFRTLASLRTDLEARGWNMADGAEDAANDWSGPSHAGPSDDHDASGAYDAET